MGRVVPMRGKRAPIAAGGEITKRTKVQTGGNSQCDVAWLEAVADEIKMLTEEEIKALDLYFEVKYQWSGYQDELNDDWFREFRVANRRNPEGKELRWCTGPSFVRDERGGYVIDAEGARLKRPCLSHPALGAVVCHKHGAQTAHVKLAAAQRLAEASELVAMRLVGLTDVRDEEGSAIDHKNRIAASNSVLDRAGIKGNMEVEVTIPGYKKVLEELFSEEPTDEAD